MPIIILALASSTTALAMGALSCNADVRCGCLCDEGGVIAPCSKIAPVDSDGPSQSDDAGATE